MQDKFVLSPDDIGYVRQQFQAVEEERELAGLGIRIVLSGHNTKLGKVLNISLPPVMTCKPGIPCANGCYANKAWRMYENVRSAWLRNYAAYKRAPERYFEAVALACQEKKQQHFRWHVSGDIVDQAYLLGMARVALCCPDTKFLCFTKREDFIHNFRSPANLKVILSLWPGAMPVLAPVEAYNTAWLHPDKGEGPAYEAYMHALETHAPRLLPCSGRCDECFECWHQVPGAGVVFHEH